MAEAVWLSLRLSAATVAILCVIGLPLAWWIAGTQWRGKFLLEAVVALPIVLPPTVAGFYLLQVLGSHGRLGAAGGLLPLPFTFGGILIGSVVFNFPFAVRPFIVGFSGVDKKLVEASWCLGVSKAATVFRVILPLAWPGILTGVILAFAHTLGEFGVVLMLGGNIPGVTQTLSIMIYDKVQAMDYASANEASAFLLLFSFGALCAAFALQRRVPV